MPDAYSSFTPTSSRTTVSGNPDPTALLMGLLAAEPRKPTPAAPVQQQLQPAYVPQNRPGPNRPKLGSAGQVRTAQGGGGGRTPIYTKTVGGPGMIPGTIRLNQWEPGASFAGFSSGGGPANATIDRPGPSRASLVPSGTPAGAYDPYAPTGGGPDERADWYGLNSGADERLRALLASKR